MHTGLPMLLLPALPPHPLKLVHLSKLRLKPLPPRTLLAALPPHMPLGSPLPALLLPPLMLRLLSRLSAHGLELTPPREALTELRSLVLPPLPLMLLCPLMNAKLLGLLLPLQLLLLLPGGLSG